MDMRLFITAFDNFLNNSYEGSSTDWVIVNYSYGSGWNYYTFEIVSGLLVPYIFKLFLVLSTLYAMDVRVELIEFKLCVKIICHDNNFRKFVEQWK